MGLFRRFLARFASSIEDFSNVIADAAAEPLPGETGRTKRRRLRTERRTKRRIRKETPAQRAVREVQERIAEPLRQRPRRSGEPVAEELLDFAEGEGEPSRYVWIEGKGELLPENERSAYHDQQDALDAYDSLEGAGVSEYWMAVYYDSERDVFLLIVNPSP